MRFVFHVFLRPAWGRAVAFCRDRQTNASCSGFSVIELVIALAIVATLAGIAIPVLSSQIDKARTARIVTEIRGLERIILAYATANGTYPDSLADCGQGGSSDPWGNPYQYLKVEGAKKGKLRKDRFLVPVNSDYDLYSMGKDGKSSGPFTAKSSRDDIVRANDGGFVGLVSEF